MNEPASQTVSTPNQPVDLFLAKFSPEIEALGRNLLRKVSKRLPHAIEFVDDNDNGLVCGFGPNDRPSDAIFSMVLFPRKVALCFLPKSKLPDPHERLKGSGNRVRNGTLDQANGLDRPYVRAPTEGALRRAKAPAHPKQRRRLIIRSISAKQRSRRPA